MLRLRSHHPLSHAPIAHDPLAHTELAFGYSHRRAQRPQLVVFESRFASHPSLGSLSQSANRATHSAIVQRPAAHAAAALANEHVVPQAPQFAMLGPIAAPMFVSVSQPLATSPSQFARGAAHVSGPVPHTPAVQVATIPGAGGQAVRQPPQFIGSVEVSTSQPFSTFPSQLRRPPSQ